MHVLNLSAADIEKRLTTLPDHVVDQDYLATSEHPISGKAVAQAVEELETTVMETIDYKPGETTVTGADYGQSDYADVRGERFNDYDEVNGNRALAAGSHAEGIRSIEVEVTGSIIPQVKQKINQTIAGCGCFEIETKGGSIGSLAYYYCPTFDSTAKTIKVKGDASGYAAGDLVSIITDINFDECAAISSVAYNSSANATTITLETWPEGLRQGGTSVLSNDKVTSYVPMTLRVPAKPLIGTTFLGLGAHTEGVGTKAAADGAHAEGRETMAFGRYSHAEGRETKAHYAAHAEGWRTKATGDYAHAEGKDTTASGYISHTEGELTEATGDASHAEGYDTEATGNKSHAEGNQTKATAAASHAEGDQTQATASGSHAEGYKTIASSNAAHAEGESTQAIGKDSHAEGRNTQAGYIQGDGTAAGTTAHAEGNDTVAKGYASHTEGSETVTEGYYAHAEGLQTQALHEASHAGGTGTKTGANYQTVVGKYNKGKDTTLFEVGDGTGTDDANRRNAFEVYSDGHAEVRVQGETDGSVVTLKTLTTNVSTINTTLATKPGIKTADGGERFNHAGSATGDASHAEGNGTHATAFTAHAEGSQARARGSSSHAEGYATVASGQSSHAEGESTQAIGKDSHAEGRNTQAGDKLADNSIVGTTAHAEGNSTKALAYASHAEGNGTIAYSEAAHAEGLNTKAVGKASHAEGSEGRAEGEASHVEGNKTIAGIRGYKIITIESYSGDAQDDTRYCIFIIESSANMVPDLGKYSTIFNGILTENVYSIVSVEDLSDHGSGHLAVKTNEPMTDTHSQINFDDSETLCLLYTGTGTTGPTIFGNYSHAEGHQTRALGSRSHTEGNITLATALGAHAEGDQTQATTTCAHAEGYLSRATGKISHAEGRNTHAAGYDSHTEGSATLALGVSSHAEGFETVASGNMSHTEGNITRATAFGAHAEGDQTQATASGSHAEGYKTIASGEMSHTEGSTTQSGHLCTHAEGYNTIAGIKSSVEVTKATDYLPDGSDTSCCKFWLKTTNLGITVGDTYQTFFDNELSELSYSVTSVEGTNIVCTDQPWGESYYKFSNPSNKRSVPFLVFNRQINPEFGKYAHAEGLNTRAMGNSSHAEGRDTWAAHNYSHAGGLGTITGCPNQTVIGTYNEGKTDTLFEVGCGNSPSSTGRRNAFEVKVDGSAAVGAQGTDEMSVATKGYVDSLLGVNAGDFEDSFGDQHLIYYYSPGEGMMMIEGYTEDAFSSTYKLPDYSEVYPVEMIINFAGVQSVEHLIFPKYLKIIGSDSCRSSAFQTIKLPRTLLVIESGAFADTNITDIYYEGTQSEWSEISIGENAFPSNPEIHFNCNIYGEADNGPGVSVYVEGVEAVRPAIYIQHTAPELRPGDIWILPLN